MAVKSDRLEARISPQQHVTLARVVSPAGMSVSGFVVDAAMERAEELIASQMSTIVPADYFDRFVRTLDRAEHAPALSRAARRAERRPRITAG